MFVFGDMIPQDDFSERKKHRFNARRQSCITQHHSWPFFHQDILSLALSCLLLGLCNYIFCERGSLSSCLDTKREGYRLCFTTTSSWVGCPCSTVIAHELDPHTKQLCWQGLLAKAPELTGQQLCNRSCCCGSLVLFKLIPD